MTQVSALSPSGWIPGSLCADGGGFPPPPPMSASAAYETSQIPPAMRRGEGRRGEERRGEMKLHQLKEEIQGGHYLLLESCYCCL